MRRIGYVLLVLGFILVHMGASNAQEAPITVDVLGTYLTNTFDEGGSEIAAYDPDTQTVFVVNGASDTIDLLDIGEPTQPTLRGQIDVTAYGDGSNSVAVHDGLVAVAIQADPSQDPGVVGFFTTDGEFISQVTVGALPDMITFTPDGSKVLTANEGEPSDDYANDPEGSVSIIDISGGAEGLTDAAVTNVSFADFNEGGLRAAELDLAIRVYGPGATTAQDFEPEYITLSPDSSTAYVTLQENNALAVIDVNTGEVTALHSLGFKDFNVEGSGFDATDEDDGINIVPHPVLGMYMPDAIDLIEANGQQYLITANEGDSREYEPGFIEQAEVQEVTLDPDVFPDAADLQLEENIGKLEITNTLGDTDGDGDYDALYLPGARSFAVWTTDGTLVFDSGDQIEQITAELFPEEFNSTNDENGSFENRSDNAGPEPEGLVLGTVGDRTYAFIGLERMSGIMVFDVTDPTAPEFVTYVNNRDFTGDAEAGTAGDLGPEGLAFVPAADSPTGADLLIVANEISGSTTIYQINAAS